MDPAVDKLRQQIEPFCRQLHEVRWEHARDASTPPPLRKLYAAYPELCRVDSFLRVRERFEGKAASAPERSSLRAVLRFLGDCLIGAERAEHDEEIARQEWNAHPWENE